MKCCRMVYFKRGILPIKYFYVPIRQSRFGMRVYANIHLRLFLGEKIQRSCVNIVVNEHNGFFSFLDKAGDQTKRVVYLTVEDNFLICFFVLGEISKDSLELLVCLLLVRYLPRLHLAQSSIHDRRIGKVAAHLDKSIHNPQAGLNCRFAPQDGREHSDSLLRKSIRKMTASAISRFCYI